MRAGLLPLFGLSEISVITGLQSLWDSDVFLALIVTFFALFAPYVKTIGLALIHFGLLRRKTLPVLHVLGKLAMADIFLIAVYITLSKGIGVGRIETAWGSTSSPAAFSPPWPSGISPKSPAASSRKRKQFLSNKGDCPSILPKCLKFTVGDFTFSA